MASRFLSGLRGLLLGGLLLLTHAATAQAPAAEWQRTLGGDGQDQLGAIVQTADGGYLVGGGSTSNASGDKTQPNLGRVGQGDYWVVKLDAAGRKQWDRSYGGNDDDQLVDLCQTADGGYLLAGISTSGATGDKTQPVHGTEAIPIDYWIVKIDANGRRQWDRSFGGNHSDWLTCVRPTPDGGYLLGGRSHSGATGDKSEPNRGGDNWWPDYWVVKIDANGNKQWDRTFGTAVVDFMTCLLVMPDGGYLLGGYTAGGISGDKTQAGHGADFWLVRLDARGIRLWDRTIGGLLTDYLQSMALTPDGGLILGGSSWEGQGVDKSEPGRGWYDYWVVKLDANGNKQWDRTFGSAGADELSSVRPTPDGGYLLAGQSSGTASGDKSSSYRGTRRSPWEEPPTDYWVVKIDAAGRRQWDGVYGGTEQDRTPHVLITADGGFVVGGYSESGISGEKMEPGRGGADYWLLKFAAEPKPVAFTIPNIITPNGDQLNEQFVVQGVPAGCALQVYNRWGREVFRSADYRNDWGRAAAPGVYYYRLQLPDARQLKGWVEVKR